MNGKVGWLGALLALSWSGLVCAEDAAQHFIKDAVEGNLAEVKVGELAQQKGSSQGVKDFGALLVKDHGAANDKARQVAQTLGVTAPEAPGMKQKSMYDMLKMRSQEKFDAAFVKGMVKDHQEDIAKYQKEADSGSGPAADYAKQVLPDLRKHLQMAQQLQQQMGSANTAGVSQMK